MSHRLIWHIGSLKTGTTAMQQFLNVNQNQLQENGFSYPRIQVERYTPINGSGLSYYIKDGLVDTLNPGWIKFWEIVRKNLKENHVILSWEVIFDYKIKDFFTAVKKEYDNIQVIVYLRRQDRYIESFWNQIVKIFE